MKQFLRYSSLVIVSCIVTLTSSARVYNIDVRNAKGELTQYLREQSKNVTRNDTIVLDIPKGEYILNGTVEFKCNTVIRGSGIDRTSIVLNNGIDSNGFKAFTDDAFLMFHGKLDYPISVGISDLTIKLMEHKGIWWHDANKTSEKLAVKIYHANHVDIHNVNSFLYHAIITNYDLRVCSNVSINDCIISNYNNAEVGGNLWLRGETHNVSITRNKFYKYGNDESLGLFSNLINTRGYVKGNVSRTDISIDSNEFHYGYDGKDKVGNIVNNTLVTLVSDNNTNWLTTTRNFIVKNNKFYINDECRRCFRIEFLENDSHQNICFDGNEIVNENLRSSNKYYRYDFEIRDLGNVLDTIRVINNTVTNKNSVLNPSKTNGYSFLFLHGANVDMSGNKIVSTITTDPFTGKDTGVQLVWCGTEGGIVTMRNNVCKGIMCISTVGAGYGTKHFTLNAYNNYFAGDTRIYCNKINRLNINFTGNTLVSRDMNFFLQEFANDGTVVFNNNDVTVSRGNGQLMTHWSKISTDAMKFERLEVKNNVFRGVNSEKDLLKTITKVKKRIVQSNSVLR